jgi:LytS/YehU family sensor histidine kinase
MSPHFIFNTLNTIQAAVMNKSKEDTLDFIGDLSLVIRENLESVSEDYIPLSREISFLQRYAGVERFRLGEKIKIEFIISVEDTERLLVPPMLIQPLLENSIKHGLLPRREGGEIEVKIDQELEYLLVTVRDNGIGRAKARELVEAKKHQSRGIDLLKKRLDYLNLKNKTNAFRIVFEDLFEEGHPAGTVVRLYLQIIRRKDRQQTLKGSL